jgi:hypothetical protein
MFMWFIAAMLAGGLLNHGSTGAALTLILFAIPCLIISLQDRQRAIDKRGGRTN